MFAVEIDFQDGLSKPETIFVRRPTAFIGGQETAHVVIDDLQSHDYQLRVIRDIGRSFRCARVFLDPERGVGEETLYENSAVVPIGSMKLNIIALDSDLVVRDTEPPDRAGVRILRHASSSAAPRFPAVIVLGSPQVVVSFEKNTPMYVGRSKQCLVRIDAPEVSAQHARIGFENGEFWVEDLGSTNGTYVNQQQVSGRVSVPPAVPIVVGRDLSLMGVVSEQQLRSVERSALGVVRQRPQVERRYPVLLSVSDVARPARLILPEKGVVQLGRDPTSDLWLGAPHVSRLHCSLALNEEGVVTLTDQSTNGTAYDAGLLRRGDGVEFRDLPAVLDFGGGVTVALCFNESQEQAFIASQGAVSTFSTSNRTQSGVVGTEGGLLRSGATLGRMSGNIDLRDIPRETMNEGFFIALQNAYRSSGFQGRLVMVLALIAVVLILMVSLTLLRPLFG